MTSDRSLPRVKAVIHAQRVLCFLSEGMTHEPIASAWTNHRVTQAMTTSMMDVLKP